MSSNLISKLMDLLNYGGRKDKIKEYKELIVNELKEYIEWKLLFKLHTKQILKIFGERSIDNIK